MNFFFQILTLYLFDWVKLLSQKFRVLMTLILVVNTQNVWSKHYKREMRNTLHFIQQDLRSLVAIDGMIFKFINKRIAHYYNSFVNKFPNSLYNLIFLPIIFIKFFIEIFFKHSYNPNIITTDNVTVSRCPFNY